MDLSLSSDGRVLNSQPIKFSQIPNLLQILLVEFKTKLELK